MAADPHRSNQPLVNGQNGEGGPSKGNSNRDTVDGEDSVQKHQYPQQNPQQQQQQQPFFGQQPHPGQQQPPPHLNWPRQLRPPDPRGPPRPLQQQQPGLRRVSPWAVLRNKLPDQPQHLFHQQYRMQSDDLTRPPLNGFAPRPLQPQMAMRPPSGQLSKPPSLEGPSPPMGPTPPRSPFLQRGDSRTGAQMFSPPMPRPPLSLSPRPSLSLNRSRDDDDGDDPTMNAPGGVRPPVRFPTPQLVRTPSGGVSPVPSRPPSRASPSPTPPGAPMGPRSTPPPQSRQLSVNEPEGRSELKSSTPSPRQLSSATSQESDDTSNPPETDKPAETAKPANPEKPAEKPTEPDKPVTPTPDMPKTPVPTSTDGAKEPVKEAVKKPDEAPKRPNLLETSRQERTETLNGPDSKDSHGSKSNEPVVNGGHETPKKLPPKATATTPKKLGPVPAGAKSPSKSLPRTPQTPDTPGTSEKKNFQPGDRQMRPATSPTIKPARQADGRNFDRPNPVQSSRTRVRITEPDEIVEKNQKTEKPQRPATFGKTGPISSHSPATEKIPKLPDAKRIEHYASLPNMDIQTSTESLQLSSIMSPGTKTLSRARRQRKTLFSSFSSFDSSSPDRISIQKYTSTTVVKTRSTNLKNTIKQLVT